MGGRWMWLGMVGLCSLASGCREDDTEDAVPASPTTMQARDSASGGLLVPATPALARNTVDGNRAPSGDALPAANAQVPPDTAPPPGALPRPGPRVNEPAQGTTAQAPARQNAQATPNAARPQQAAPANANTQQANAPQRPQANPDGTPATQAPAEGRVMIGAQAVQANDDESWYEGAAKAAQAAVTDTSANRPLEQVVIASSTVSGRVTRVGRDTLHVRDGEGTVYELQLDQRSRGLRQGQRVPLKEIQEGTPVRAQFVLMGGRTVARDVQVRR
ncbi:hypothetical protein HPC50_38000 [Corallococcus exiguus]|uniref:hypothetical protein n=1 Tax=Corallococcus TaxID=83461 RepID=UPI0011C44F43|nr:MULTISPECIES: hypothetical protein [Corallococcus]NNB88135.1 hypothetical protein [Corallococcus exiguus]NPC52858.1 hypothetical protein [Corallococcus exiguus]